MLSFDWKPATCRNWEAALLVLIGLLLGTAQVIAQEIPRNQYLHYVPLEHPSLVQRTQPNLDFHLFGDPADPTFKDIEPIDGIDDARGRVLQDLGARFGPIMVANTTNLPMDFRQFMKQSQSFNLYIDTWSLVGGGNQLIRSDEVDLRSIAETPCSDIPKGGRDTAGDCLLMDLLHRYNPYHPDYETLSPRTVDPDHRNFEVMFFDFPGAGPESWKKEFEDSFSGLLPSRYWDFLKVYTHPFIREIHSAGQEPGYEFILQYYFFYPTNDGGNNHEGDWEHINVSVAPLGTVDRPLTAGEVRRILEGSDLDSLVIRYIDYYFHYQVYRMDYSAPDAYAPRQEWERQYQNQVPELQGADRIWRAIRDNAWWDEEETIPNTHPICYIGADNKGLDQLIAAPGGKNRDSHGTYPFPGLYKDIGPGGATEQINSILRPKEWYRDNDGDVTGQAQHRYGRGDAVPFTTAERIEILPDWECIVDPVMTDPVARQDWFWMLLPIRFGYPATESPFAGVIPHAETGNLAPFGPMSQPHWNRPGTEGGANNYQPHSFTTLFPLGMQDTFVNSWGYLNFTLPVLASLPPLDFAWRLVAYPFRSVLQRNDPVFFPTESIPTRFVGLNAGASFMHFNDDAAALVLNGDPGIEQILWLSLSEPGDLVSMTPEVKNATAWWWQVNFYMGKKFATQNTLLHSRSQLAIITLGTSGAEYRSEAELNLWEYAGSFRYELARGGFRPFLKAGYGWTWYRAENSTFDGVPLITPDGEWINQPSFDSFSSIMPNSWHAGAGLELIAHRSAAPLLKGMDFSLVTEVTYTSTSLDIDDWLRVAGSGDLENGLIDKLGLHRWTWSVGLTLGL